MRTSFVMGSAALLFAAMGSLTSLAAGESTKGATPSTRSNLLHAMHGEAFAYLKYSLFADAAERSGRKVLAEAFRKAADMERTEHFAELSELYNLVGNDVANLRDAIAGEDYEATTMYPSFARQALAEGNKEAADRFSEIAEDEIKHRDMFKAALKGIEPKP